MTLNNDSQSKEEGTSPQTVGGRRRRRHRNRRKGGATLLSRLSRSVVLGVLVVAALTVVVYLLWPAEKVSALTFDKTHVDLGTVTQDQEGVQTFLATNRGDGPLDVGPVDIVVEQGCDETETVQGNIKIGPGQQFLLPVRLGPHREVGPHRILVHVPSDDPTRPSSSLSLHFDVTEARQASEAGPRLNVDKELIDIGDIPYDWPLYEVFTLSNSGDAPLVLQGVPVVRVEEGC